ncbi:eukaryotic translation initiation factor 3 subunit C-like [Homalodisca vitripennis]|uniref:eukaryotic translation initiation factor 3 subunit C-like n=1 Tax=Homalodisca vitripennis TaxID=197043 RepID=UPI001EEC3C27|nr:eukaryotic translation initiation factor 3 subunit C-like [Homalodisca vitripennis]
MPTLSEMFQMEKSSVHSIISKMIINEELMASLDDPTQTVVMHRSEPSRLQSLALQLADKVNNLVESNERIFEMKQGKLLPAWWKPRTVPTELQPTRPRLGSTEA